MSWTCLSNSDWDELDFETFEIGSLPRPDRTNAP